MAMPLSYFPTPSTTLSSALGQNQNILWGKVSGVPCPYDGIHLSGTGNWKLNLNLGLVSDTRSQIIYFYSLD